MSYNPILVRAILITGVFLAGPMGCTLDDETPVFFAPTPQPDVEVPENIPDVGGEEDVGEADAVQPDFDAIERPVQQLRVQRGDPRLQGAGPV